MQKEFKVGDIVVYSRQFLRNSGQFTGLVPFATGKVVAVRPFLDGFQLLEVEWDFASMNILSCNVILKSERHLEPA